MLIGDVVPSTNTSNQAATPKQTRLPDRMILRQLMWLNIACVFTYGAYTFFFPLFFLKVPCYRCQSHYTDAFTLVVLTTFLTSDCVGRLLPMWERLMRRVSLRALLVITYLKIPFCVLVPLQVLPLAGAGRLPLVRSDALLVATCVLFPVTTTFYTTGVVVKCQALFGAAAERQRALFFLNVFMEAGLSLGCAASMALVPLFGA